MVFASQNGAATEAVAGLSSEPGTLLFARGTASGASSLGGRAIFDVTAPGGDWRCSSTTGPCVQGPLDARSPV